MPTFRFDNSAASNSAILLLDLPNVDWFKDSVLQALAQMVIPGDWFGDDNDYRTYAISQASRMLATYKMLNFNPFPVGIIIPFSSDETPPGYLLCDGTDYAVTEFPELFAVIGYNYGGADDRFNTPDLRNRVLVDTGSTYDIGATGGVDAVELTTDQIPAHSHTDSGHTHLYTPPGATVLAVVPGEVPVSVPSIFPSSTDSGSADIQNTGGGEAHENRQPYFAVPYMIYAGR